jgi:hypothetical protein
VSLESYFDGSIDTYIDDLDMTPRDKITDGLVDIIGERDDTPIYVAFGSDDAVYDSGKALSILKRSQPPRIIQYVSEQAHRLVIENLDSYATNGELECYAASHEHNTTRFTPYGTTKDDQSPDNPVVSFLLSKYASSEEERSLVRRVYDYVYDEEI